jgi:hypothetical protein
MTSISRLLQAGAAVALTAALGVACAQPGGPGRGLGGGPGYGYGCGQGPGYGGGRGYGCGPNDTPGWALMTEQERIEHRDRMHSLKTVDECKAYMTDFSSKMQERAKERGTTMRGPNEFACERMRERGFLK